MYTDGLTWRCFKIISVIDEKNINELRKDYIKNIQKIKQQDLQIYRTWIFEKCANQT